MYNPLISNLSEQWDRVLKCLNKYSWQLKEGKNTAFSTLSGQTKTLSHSACGDRGLKEQERDALQSTSFTSLDKVPFGCP